MAGAKRKHARQTKKRRSRSSPSPTPPSIRTVRRSSAPTTVEAARRLGVSPSTVRRRISRGELGAVVDERGRYHVTGKAAAPPPRRAAAPPPRRAAAPPPRRAATPPPRRAAAPPPRRAAKKPPFRKKRGRSAPLVKKRPSARAPSPLGPSIRAVRESSSPNLRQAARLFGISAKRLETLVLAGKVRALRDAEGTLHIPAAELQAAQYAGKRRRKKRAREGARPAPPWKTTSEERRREKKKGRKKRKLVPGKKKKRVRKTKPARERFRDAIIEDTRPSVHAEPAARPPEPSPAAPMAMEEAGQRIGNALRDFVMARPRWERLETGRVYHDLKVAFRKAYGERRWRDTYEWCVDEWGLEDYIFDYEALRDS